MKGQKSLEMIIGLVMLLVVASVTISMFLNVFQEPDLGEQTQAKQEIMNSCTDKCGSFKDASEERTQLSAALEYCTAKFSRDVNQDGSTNDVAGAGYNSYCEDGIHCFNVHTCNTGIDEELDAERCRKLMCEYYAKVNNDQYEPVSNPGENDPQDVHNHIQDVMSPQNEETGVGTCGLSNVEDSAGYELSTWYDPKGDEYSFAGGEESQNNVPLSCGEEAQGIGGGTNIEDNPTWQKADESCRNWEDSDGINYSGASTDPKFLCENTGSPVWFELPGGSNTLGKVVNSTGQMQNDYICGDSTQAVGCVQ